MTEKVTNSPQIIDFNIKMLIPLIYCVIGMKFIVVEYLWFRTLIAVNLFIFEPINWLVISITNFSCSPMCTSFAGFRRSNRGGTK